MSPRSKVGAAGVLLTALLAGCDREPSFGPDLTGQAELRANAYFEYNLEPGSPGDPPALGLRLQVLLPGSDTEVAAGVADALGRIEIPGIPIGTYDVRVDPSYLSDTLEVVALDSTRITLFPGAEYDFDVGVTPPSATLAEIRTLPVGRRVWLVGMALNNRSSSIEGAVHVLEEPAGALRARFTAATGGNAGDSVRVLGRIAGSGVERTLEEARLVVEAQSVRPILPVEVGIAEARSAGGGSLAARLVVIRSGEVVAVTAEPFVGQHLRVSEGGAEVRVFLPNQNGFEVPVVVGSRVVVAAGLLVPDPSASGAWRIVPRGTGEFSVTPPAPPG